MCKEGSSTTLLVSPARISLDALLSLGTLCNLTALLARVAHQLDCLGQADLHIRGELLIRRKLT
jgi:hypothetical protein